MMWFKDIKAILINEPEIWLTYLYGQQMYNRPQFSEVRPGHPGIFFQIVKFFMALLKVTRVRRYRQPNPFGKLLVFAGTYNQMASLETTLHELEERGHTPSLVANRSLLSKFDGFEYAIPVQLNITDALRVLALFLLRGRYLHSQVKEIHHVSVDWHFSRFCSVYIYLVYFHRILSQAKPDFVLTANDHNASNRCMLAVAHHMGIKTAYMQHASVSNIFPALRVNYAFLDGQCALDTYLMCEPNQPATPRNVPVPEVILSGQKKHLRRVYNKHSTIIGVALNALDESGTGIDFVKVLATHGFKVCIRWHPAMTPQQTVRYRTEFAESQLITLSDPGKQPVSDFMDNISLLIAGNSSIHLEAALVGVQPIYYELSSPDVSDYYGYVKNGLAQEANSVEDIIELIKQKKDNDVSNESAVRYYSATYLSEWDGQEGALVAKYLLKLINGEAHEELFGYIGRYR